MRRANEAARGERVRIAFDWETRGGRRRDVGHGDPGNGVERTHGERPRGFERVRRSETSRWGCKYRSFCGSRRDVRPSSVDARRRALFRARAVRRPIYRAPTMKCIFQTLLDATQTKHVGYINGDILIFSDFLDTLAAIEREHDRFFMVGRRRNVPAPGGEVSRMQGELDWEELETKVCEFPVDGGGAIDYFVLPSRDAEYLRNIPPFIVGNWRWDNVVVSLASIFMDLHVIDATKTVTALHQGQEKVAQREDRPASAHNHGLAIHLLRTAYRRGSINCAKYESHYGTRQQSNRVLLRAKRTLASWVCNHRESRAVSYMRHKMAT